PLPDLLAAVRPRRGIVLVDDTQALGLAGVRPRPGAPYGAGGGGTAAALAGPAGAPPGAGGAPPAAGAPAPAAGRPPGRAGWPGPGSPARPAPTPGRRRPPPGPPCTARSPATAPRGRPAGCGWPGWWGSSAGCCASAGSPGLAGGSGRPRSFR